MQDRSFFVTKEAYRCLACRKAAADNYSCCSKECRSKIPNCKIEGCSKATVQGIYQGETIYSENCYKHGGRERHDRDETFRVREKRTFVLTTGGWYEPIVNYDHLTTDEPLKKPSL